MDEIPRNEDSKPLTQAIRSLIQAKLRKHDSRQLHKAFRFSFDLVSKPNFENLDSWLTKIFCIDLPTETPASYARENSSENDAIQWVWRYLLIARVLLHASRVPTFASPRILSCEAGEVSSLEYKTVVTLGDVAHLPKNVIPLCIDAAKKLALEFYEKKPDDKNSASVFFEIENRLLPRVSNLTQLGKSSFPILRAAFDKAIPFHHLGSGVYQLGWGAKSIRIDRSTTENDSAIGAKYSTNKYAAANLLRSVGLPAPNHYTVQTLEQAHNAAQALGWPVVVKPLKGERGEGISVDVGNKEQLAQALSHAQQSSKEKVVLVEKQVEGICHRLFIVEGKLLYGVKRLPMSVEADGMLPISELVSREHHRQQCKPPWLRSEIQELDEEARTAIQSAGYTESSIPEQGTLIPLRRIESTLHGGVDEEVTNQIHPDNISIAVNAARMFNLQVAGVDIITEDIALPWYKTGAVINEVNFSPLLGGGEISRKAIPEYLERLIPGNGRIPVHVFVGGKSALHSAKLRWQKLCDSGLRTFLTSHNTTYGPDKLPCYFTNTGVQERSRSLLLNQTAEALVVVVQTDEILRNGLPFEWIDSLEIIDDQLRSTSAPSELIDRNSFDKIIRLLRQLSPE